MRMITVRVPNSLHEELLDEARKEAGGESQPVVLHKSCEVARVVPSERCPGGNHPARRAQTPYPKRVKRVCLNVPVAFGEETEKWE